MSVVATKITGKEIVIAADSYRGRDWIGTQDKDKEAKIFRADHGMIVGTVGWTEEFALMKLFLLSHFPKDPSEDAVMEFMSEFHDWVRGKTGNSSYVLRNGWHLVCGGAAFTVDNGYDVRRITGFDAIGAGGVYALTALHLGQSVEQAVTTACDLSSYCEAPVNVFRVPVGTGMETDAQA